MTCACCGGETVTCLDGTTRNVPGSVSVSVSVTLTVQRTSNACESVFPPAVNGTYVLARLPGSGIGYSGQFGNLFIGFDLAATGPSSLLRFIWCEPQGGPCVLASVWLLDQTYPTLCDWPNAGTGSVSTSDIVATSAYASCVTSFVGRQNDYSGSFTVSLL